MFSLKKGFKLFCISQRTFRWYMSFKVFFPQLDAIIVIYHPLLLRPKLCKRTWVSLIGSIRDTPSGTVLLTLSAFHLNKSLCCLQARWICWVTWVTQCPCMIFKHLWKILLICVFSLPSHSASAKEWTTFLKPQSLFLLLWNFYDQSWLHGFGCSLNLLGCPENNFLPVNISKSA